MKMERNNYTIETLVKRAIKFSKDYQVSAVDTETLDNIRGLCLSVQQCFNLSKKTEDNLNDICHKCLVAYDHMTPNYDKKAMKKQIHSIRIDLIGELRLAKIDIF